MQLPIWNHLTPEFYQRVRARQCLEVADLSPNVVTYHVASQHFAIDWDHVILLKACKIGNQRRGKTVIWNASGGFVCVDVAPKTLIDRLEAHSPVTWQDMRAYTDIIDGQRPLVYVLGTLQLIPIGFKKTQQSWLNAKYLRTVNPWMPTQQEKLALVTLTTHTDLRIRDTATRLNKKWREANKIKRIQQINKEYNDELYGSHYLANVQVPATVADFRVQVQERLLMYVDSRLKLNLTPAEIKQIVDAARHNRDWPLDTHP